MMGARRVNAEGIEESYGVIPVRKTGEASWSVFVVQARCKSRHWSFPKGGVEAADFDGLATASRELTEETGLHVERVLRSEPFTTEYINGFSKRRKRVGYFLASVTGIVELQAKEINDGVWLACDAQTDQVVDHLTFDDDKEMWRRVREVLLRVQ